MQRFKLIIFLLVLSSLLVANDDLTSFLMDRVRFEPDYISRQNRLNSALAERDILRSANWFDIHLSYKNYANEIDRLEKDTTSKEDSSIDEDDERWRIEASRKFFDNDFSTTEDKIENSINLVRYKYDLILEQYLKLDDIIDDMIEYEESIAKIRYFSEKLNVKIKENSIMENLYEKGIIEPTVLIENLEMIELLEEKLNNWKSKQKTFDQDYNKSHDEFITLLSSYIVKTSLQADTLKFIHKLDEYEHLRVIELEEVSNRIKKSESSYLFPEIELNLSTNKRVTNQEWNITKSNGNQKTFERETEENYLEGEIEVTIPFNLYSNLKGKKRLLRSFKSELSLKSDLLDFDYERFKIEILDSYHKYLSRYRRRKRLEELHSREYESYKKQQIKSGIDDTLDQKLIKVEARYEKARLNSYITRLELYKYIFIINNFGEINEINP
jgi:hypothetical protein